MKSSTINFRISRLISFSIILFALACKLAFAQPAPDSVAAEQDESIAEKVNDPTATLTQVQIKDIYTPAEYGTNAQPNTIQFRTVLAIQPSEFIPFEQLIRPTLKVVTEPDGKGGSTTTGYADMQLFDLFVMPWPNSRETEFRWGFGPYLVFPTSTNKSRRQWSMADGARWRLFVSGGTGAEYRRPAATGDIVRIYIIPFCPSRVIYISTNTELSVGTRLVRESQRCHLDNKSAAQHSDNHTA